MPGASWLLVGGLVVQVLLAELGVFDYLDRFEVHRNFGYRLELLPFVMIIVGLVVGVRRRSVGLAAVVLVLFFVQSLLAAVPTDAPMVAAIHPVNGFLIPLLAIVVARQWWFARTPGTAVA